jgi:hypothetical protein
MQMQRERALIPKVGLVIRSSELVDQEKRQKSAVSGRDLQKPFGKFKTIIFPLMTKY